MAVLLLQMLKCVRGVLNFYRLSKSLAEGEGFEPPEHLTAFSGFQVLVSSCCPGTSGVVLYRPALFASRLQHERYDLWQFAGATPNYRVP